jgi:hypothetical protein
MHGCCVDLLRFVTCVPGLASGLALAVRPAGLAEAPGKRRAGGASRAAGCGAPLEAGGASPDNARRSGPPACDIFTAIGVLGAWETAWAVVLAGWKGSMKSFLDWIESHIQLIASTSTTAILAHNAREIALRRPTRR